MCDMSNASACGVSVYVCVLCACVVFSYVYVHPYIVGSLRAVTGGVGDAAPYNGVMSSESRADRPVAKRRRKKMRR